VKDNRVEANEWSLASRFAGEPLQEGMEREVSAPDLSLRDLLAHPRRVAIEFPAVRMVEYPADGSATEIIREQQAISGAFKLSAEQVDTNIFKLSIEIENTTPETGAVTSRRDAVLFQSFISTHTILRVRQGSFISLLEPPEELQTLVKGCQNLRTWPVLIGNEGERDAMLSSPIILYDYPQIAPESPGPLFDGTEIDEILTLRIMTLTDEEKEQMRQDERTREILERTEALTPEQFMKMHGTIRDLRPISALIQATNDAGASTFGQVACKESEGEKA
jgi:hydrogenase maturation protease